MNYSELRLEFNRIKNNQDFIAEFILNNEFS